jgi:hypothetical protein
LQRVYNPERRIFVVHPIPKFRDWDPRNCSTVLWLADASSCGSAVDRRQVEDNRQNAVRAEAKAVRSTSAVAIDVYGELCIPQGCSTLVDEVWLWRDGSHISVAASEMLANFFNDVFAEEFKN